VSYRAVVGDREAGSGAVAVSLRDGRRLESMPAAAFIGAVAAAVHSQDLWP
jgi:threonyl-tRNA synthetase